MGHAIEQVRNALLAERLTINALDDGSGVLLDIEGEQLMTLNPSGMLLIVALRHGAETYAQLGASLASVYEVESARAVADAETIVTRIAEALD